MSSSTSSESSSQQPITTSNAEQTLKLKTMISKEDETIDDWEQLDQIKIEKSLKSIKVKMNENEEMVNLNKGSTDQSASNPITQSSGLTTAATSTPAPFQNQFPQSFKILKRPPSDKKLNEMQQNQNQSNSSQQIKSFEQREQEYAQARLRILGSAHPEDSSSVVNNFTSNTINLNTNTANPTNNLTSLNYNTNATANSFNSKVTMNENVIVNNQNSQYYQYQNSITTQPIAYNNYNSSYQNQQGKNVSNSSNNFNTNNNNNNPFFNNIIRYPLVPDGLTKGLHTNYNNNNTKSNNDNNCNVVNNKTMSNFNFNKNNN